MFQKCRVSLEEEEKWCLQSSSSSFDPLCVREMLAFEDAKPPDEEFLNTCYNWVSKLVSEVLSLLRESKDTLTLFGLNQPDDKPKEKPSAPS